MQTPCGKATSQCCIERIPAAARRADVYDGDDVQVRQRLTIRQGKFWIKLMKKDHKQSLLVV